MFFVFTSTCKVLCFASYVAANFLPLSAAAAAPDSSAEDDFQKLQRNESSSLHERARKVLELTWRTTTTRPGWRREKRSDDGDVIDSRRGPSRKIFRLTGRVELSPRRLLEELFHKIEQVPAWNPTVAKSQVLQKIDENTDITYQVTAKIAAGIISSRDFVVLRQWAEKEGHFIAAARSTSNNFKPEQDGIIRAHSGPGCWLISPIEHEPDACKVQWLMDTDLKGWLPRVAVDRAIPRAMEDFMRHLRSHVRTLRGR
ncbi:steroidogenic acute regulatory protein, mitochondrial-like [Neocloeon triangulifer]|uniref:steroidogenic acute regulatory protein, mitochondrial-like n=1 Tax=Neocloeon triangulifer TaxID=2078957 RepID=UPI00286EC3F0|nr:steroidogenic acute regulatory protein, mitochondrial-like [Neocloeon triangulifer]